MDVLEIYHNIWWSMDVLESMMQTSRSQRPPQGKKAIAGQQIEVYNPAYAALRKEFK